MGKGRNEEPGFLELLERQAGVVARGQVLGLGWSAHEVVAAVRDRWVTVHRGVYRVPHRTVDAPLEESRAWAALLYAGSGAALSHDTALWLAGVTQQMTSPVHVTVPGSRRVKPQAGLRIHVARRHPVLVPATGFPPRTRTAEALLDTTEALHKAIDVVDLVLRATQARLAGVPQVRAALAARRAHRWRHLIGAMLAEVVEGVTSMLEREYLHKVERPHGLPRASRNRPEQQKGGRLYRDVRYSPWNVIVELDGQEAHPRYAAHRDRGRDNRSTVGGDATLRYGWHETVGNPCEVAGEVAALLTRQGWTGSPRPCGSACPLTGSLVDPGA